MQAYFTKSKLFVSFSCIFHFFFVILHRGLFWNNIIEIEYRSQTSGGDRGIAQ